ncbi:MAG TPA: hypothetical protein VMQ56_05870 [Terracidiphilus sp.]|jgi:hypothetical protein|nr:hypothetical protein [Terracidiphilus sp.]
MRGRQIALGIAFLLLVPLAVLAAPSRTWQDGELLSRKTVPLGRTFLRNRYVYRVRGLNREYVVVSETPLNADLYVPIKFSPDRRQILIQDADGREHKVHILQRAVVSLRR